MRTLRTALVALLIAVTAFMGGGIAVAGDGGLNDYTNKYRNDAGLPSLPAHQNLTYLAQTKANELATANGGLSGMSVEWEGYGFETGKPLISYSNTIPGVFESYLKDGYGSFMVTDGWTHVGSGYAQGENGRVYGVVVVARAIPPAPKPAPAPAPVITTPAPAASAPVVQAPAPVVTTPPPAPVETVAPVVEAPKPEPTVAPEPTKAPKPTKAPELTPTPTPTKTATPKPTVETTPLASPSATARPTSTPEPTKDPEDAIEVEEASENEAFRNVAKPIAGYGSLGFAALSGFSFFRKRSLDRSLARFTNNMM